MQPNSLECPWRRLPVFSPCIMAGNEQFCGAEVKWNLQSNTWLLHRTRALSSKSPMLHRTIPSSKKHRKFGIFQLACNTCTRTSIDTDIHLWIQYIHAYMYTHTNPYTIKHNENKEVHTPTHTCSRAHMQKLDGRTSTNWMNMEFPKMTFASELGMHVQDRSQAYSNHSGKTCASEKTSSAVVIGQELAIQVLWGFLSSKCIAFQLAVSFASDQLKRHERSVGKMRRSSQKGWPL